MATSAAASDLGPALPPLCMLRSTANEAYQLVQILQHSIGTGDHLRAGRTYEKLKALFGSVEPPAGG
ncbi:hypothetical protein V6U71_21555 [Sphingopyxis sp. J-6]|uniref:hypothetical protein n=1 Tax=Sphingopyxis sp. J-6 TaxID=3122054 RepID=UPI0039841745